ncbi:hypothetical protein LOC68_24935 [Blastopirellula sp. JC732]|uniref:Uncharacterized protein n=1 Tax=Blastopirellula sediminis TaxID=2894196 RepID=A0A9X1MRQ8_9BACT|nr:hypothetical protein [Blastopirellula sediminis]MCC9605044.1 hypothetical protein [Blastopirellula sediminis]MCC9631656.1 hypothetical protein [Blastopirellula sediminis]
MSTVIEPQSLADSQVVLARRALLRYVVANGIDDPEQAVQTTRELIEVALYQIPADLVGRERTRAIIYYGIQEFGNRPESRFLDVERLSAVPNEAGSPMRMQDLHEPPIVVNPDFYLAAWRRTQDVVRQLALSMRML